MKVGDRVVVKILNASLWAMGSAKALDGMRGVVEKIQPVNAIGGGGVLVAFDAPAPKWRSNQTPATCHWFDPSELVLL